MNKKSKILCAAILTVTLSILPAAAFAHGGHHGNRGNHCGQYTNRDTYYYCDGHQAHLHANGSCPYAQASNDTTGSNDVYYYCNGHQAHLHANGSCPYAQASNDTSNDVYYYCDGHQAHLHANGSCPYAQASNDTTGSNDVYYYCDGHQAHLHANGSCPYINSYTNENTADASFNPQAAPAMSGTARIHAACWQNTNLQNPFAPCYEMLQLTMNYQSALCLGLAANENDIYQENNYANMPLCQINGTCQLVQNNL